MVASRRRLFVTSWATLSAQLIVLVLGTAQVCADREHTHGGIAAPDCRMHHQSGSAQVSEHAHHGHASDEATGGAQIKCRCANDFLPTYLGQKAVLELPVASPFVEAAPLEPRSVISTAGHSFSPPSPPPRS